MPWAMLAVLFVLALIFSAVGFYRVVYFISIGYAFSIVAMAVTSWSAVPRSHMGVGAAQHPVDHLGPTAGHLLAPP